MPTHERYETSLARTGHHFYAWRAQGIKNWETMYAPVPPNYMLLDPRRGDNQIPHWVDIDLVLSQNKVGQFQLGQAIASALLVPFISMEHTLPMPDYSAEQIAQVRAMSGDIDVFVSEYGRKAWGYPEDHGEVNHTGIDLNVFVPGEVEREGHVLSVVNDWINRDWCCGFRIWEQVSGAGRIFPVKVLGNTPGLSEPAESVAALVEAYQTAGVYLNTTTVSSLPTVILEAMACGCPVVSTATCLIPEIVIEHGVNGFVSNELKELRSYTELLLKDKKLAREMGEAGRKTVEEKFSLDRFVEKWNEIFRKAVE